MVTYSFIEYNSVYAGTDRPDLKYLHRFKTEVAKKWFDLGVELINDRVDKLNSIQKDNLNDNEMCCSKMFQLWLQKSKTASWDQLIRALNQSPINMPELAEKIKDKLYVGECISMHCLLTL